MTHYTLIRGPAGIGKTTISRALAIEINAEVIHFDRVLAELGLGYIPGEKFIPLPRFLEADKTVVPKSIEILMRRNLVIDGNFYHKEHIEDLITQIDSQHFVFTLKADLEECILRDKNREGSLGKQAVGDVYRLTMAFDYGTVVDTNRKTVDEVVRELREYLLI